MAELIDSALASVRTYDRAAENRGPVPPGWTEPETWYRPDGATGFSASLFQNGNELIIAYTGTNEYVKDFAVANLPAALGIISPQVIVAIQYYAEVRAAFPDAEISFTGHSLGGGFASLMSVFFDHPPTVFAPAPFAASANPVTAAQYYAIYTAYQLSRLRACAAGLLIAVTRRGCAVSRGAPPIPRATMR